MYSVKRIILAAFLFLLASCTGHSGREPNSTVQHIFIESSFADLIWQKNNIMVFIDLGAPMLTAAPNRVIALGIQPKKLYSFDSLTGELSWEKPGAFPEVLATHNSTIYLTNSSNFEAYNALDGKKIFDTLLPNSGLFMSINFDEDNIFLNSANDSFFMLDMNGNIVKSAGPNTYPMPYIIENEVTYAGNTYGIIANDTQTGDMIWQVDIPEEGFYTGPYFSEDNIYIRTGSSTVPGKVYAIDKRDGTILWEIDSDAISNVCVLGNNLYFLTRDGFLMVLDRQTGSEVEKLEFFPRPFILPTAEWRLGGYYVASDPSNNIIVVSLGDSYQLFALKINNL
jgi:outer membrane protein assembly factor BamB